MHCGCLGSGHGHADLLHVDLYGYGEDILIDSGRYNYQESPIRQKLKSAAAHNTFTADNKEFTVYQNSWDYSPIAMPVKGEYNFTSRVDYISGGHLGYLGKGLYVSRKIVFIKPDIYLLFDEAYGKGQHDYTQYFHFNNKECVTLENGIVQYRGSHARATLLPLTPKAECSLVNAPLSRVYNKLEEGKCLEVNHRAVGNTCMITVISVSPAENAQDIAAELIPVSLTRTGEVLGDDYAHAVRLHKNGEQYTVLCLHQEVISEVGLLEAGGFQGYGKVLVFSDEEPQGLCLAW